MKKIDLIALDLDGTALNPQNQVSPATADAVRRARESGIHVVVSTGRICGEARDFALMLGTDDQMVTSGGATLSSVSQERCTMRMCRACVCCGGAHRHDHDGVCRGDVAHYSV